MRLFVIIFNLLSSLISIGTLIYVVVDIILEKKKMKASENITADEALPKDESIKEKPTDKTLLPDTVDRIDAERADLLLEDSVAIAAAKTESGAGVGYRGYINIGDIDAEFNANETVTLASLKERGLIEKKAKRIKILADGVLTKPLTVKAESFSVQAVKMIELTGGSVIFLK